MADVWVIYRTLCTMCGDSKEFQSEQGARSYINEHQRSHDTAPVNFVTPLNENGKHDSTTTTG